MSHAQFTWSSFLHSSPKTTASWLSQTWKMRRQGREGRRAAIQATAGGIQEEQLIFVRKKLSGVQKATKMSQVKKWQISGIIHVEELDRGRVTARCLNIKNSVWVWDKIKYWVIMGNVCRSLIIWSMLNEQLLLYRWFWRINYHLSTERATSM